MTFSPTFKKHLPILQWLPSYTWIFFRYDLIAGITLASFVLPESMAYARLAGLPAEAGIYCCIIGGLLFALFTTSKQMAVGPTSAISLMVGTTVAVLSGGNLEQTIAIASLTAFSIFALCLLAYFLNLSSLMSFVSENILLGFKAGAALTIISTQLPKLFSIEPSGSNFFIRVFELGKSLPEANLTVFSFRSRRIHFTQVRSSLLSGKTCFTGGRICDFVPFLDLPSRRSWVSHGGENPKRATRIPTAKSAF